MTETTFLITSRLSISTIANDRESTSWIICIWITQRMCLITQACDLLLMDNPSVEMEICFLFRSVSHGLLNPDIWYCWRFPCLLNSVLGLFSYLSLPVPDTSSSHCPAKHFLLPFACAEGACGCGYWIVIQTFGKQSLSQLLEMGMLQIEGLWPTTIKQPHHWGVYGLFHASSVWLKQVGLEDWRLIPFFLSRPCNKLGIAEGLGRALQRK